MLHSLAIAQSLEMKTQDEYQACWKTFISCQAVRRTQLLRVCRGDQSHTEAPPPAMEDFEGWQDAPMLLRPKPLADQVVQGLDNGRIPINTGRCACWPPAVMRPPVAPCTRMSHTALSITSCVSKNCSPSGQLCMLRQKAVCFHCHMWHAEHVAWLGLIVLVARLLQASAIRDCPANAHDVCSIIISRGSGGRLTWTCRPGHPLP